MKSLLVTLILSCLFMTACSSGGGSGGGGNANTPDTPAGKVPRPSDDRNPTPVKSSCAEKEIHNCGLFGLTDQELMDIRINLPFNIKGDFKNLELSEVQVSMMRSALLTDWIHDHYRHARSDDSEKEMKNYIAYFKSIKWRGDSL